MLCLTLASGEYITIGENVVLQYDNTKNNRCHLTISAPREVKILRGALREREGQQRPDCVFEKPTVHRKELPWNRSKGQSLAIIRRTLAGMEDTEEVRILRKQLDQIFPPKEEEKDSTKAST